MANVWYKTEIKEITFSLQSSFFEAGFLKRAYDTLKCFFTRMCASLEWHV